MKQVKPPEEWRREAPDGPFGPELAWWRGGATVIGTDEAGRGPLAGPVVAAAVAFDPGVRIAGIGDSKALRPHRREELAEEIKTLALAWSVAESDPARIDEINILQATGEAMDRAVRAVAKQLEAGHPAVLVDGRIPRLGIGRHINLVHGDALSFSIGAASILAKVHRDRLMVEAAERHPGYGFDRHKGYPTRAHGEALLRLGPCLLHRLSFHFTTRDGVRWNIGDLADGRVGRRRRK
ncbi:MAG TPA: ribonuclease HII [Bacteroidetes bacterium]|nr:ribonuclease HII [Bacteroidota bacterium]